MKRNPLPITESGPLCTAVVGNSADLFREIMAMYAPGGSRCLDLNWGKGRFWKRVDPDAYQVVGLDISEKLHSTTCAHWLVRGDNNRLPFRDECFDVCVLDPPFGTTSSTAQTIVTASRYNLKGVKHFQDIMRMYMDGMFHAHNALRPRGLLILKCQDIITRGVYQPVHYDISKQGWDYGFDIIMTYVLVRKGKPIMRHAYQYNPRSNMTYFMVFRKGW